MASDYFLDALDRYRQSRAVLLGCSPGDFDNHNLVIVSRPEGPRLKSVFLALTFGTGTVVSVEPPYLEWVRANAPRDKHYRAMFPNVLLQPLVEEASRRGDPLDWRSPNLSFLPGQKPAPRPLPGGLSELPFGNEWRDRHFPAGEFHNSLGEPEEPDDGGFRYGLALMDGEVPAAVAGGWDDCEGLTEIGVDVARPYRGQGLGVAVVSRLASAIAERGEVPTYYCAPTNIRSHRNALACGFVPVASAARAVRRRPTAASPS